MDNIKVAILKALIKNQIEIGNQDLKSIVNQDDLITVKSMVNGYNSLLLKIDSFLDDIKKSADKKGLNIARP